MSIQSKITKKIDEVKNNVSKISINTSNCNTGRLVDEIEQGERPLPIIKDNKTKEFIDLLVSCLKHFEAKPSNDELFKMIYSFPTQDVWDCDVKVDDFNERERNIYVNKDSDWVRNKLVKLLCKLCRKYSYNNVKNNEHFNDKIAAVNETRFMFLGDKGQGKTFFINYMLTTCKDEFDKSKVIYIRYDFNKLINYFNSDFASILLFQAVKIVRLYYYDKICIDECHFNSFLHEKMKLKLGKFYDVTQVDNYIVEFLSIDSSTSILSSKKIFQHFILDYMYYCMDYAYLFVLDGLDFLGLNKIHIERFELFCQQLLKLVFWEHFRIGVYIIAMRHISYEYINSMAPADGRLTFRDARRLSLVRVSLADILDNRISYFLNVVLTSPYYNDLSWVMSVHIDKVFTMLLSYVAIGLEFMPKSNKGEWCEVLDDIYMDLSKTIFCGNVRRLMDFIKHLVEYQLPKLINGDIKNLFDYKMENAPVFWDKYRMVEEMVLGRNKYHAARHVYSFDEKSHRVEFSPCVCCDFYIPNIFNFVDISYSQNNQIRLLFKVRLLQYLIYHGTQPRYTVVQDFFMYFSLETTIIEAEIDEAIYLGFVVVVPGATGFGKNYKLKASYLGEYLLNEMIYNYTYLQHVINNTPVPSTLKHKNTNIMKYVPQFSDRKRSEWSVNYFKNVFAFLAYVDVVESNEIEMYNNKDKIPFNSSVQVLSSFKDDVFKNIHYKMKRNVVKSVVRIIKSARERGNYDLMRAYSDYFKLQE